MVKAKYSTNFKLEIILSISQGKKTVEESSKEYDIHSSIIRKWLSAYKQNGTDGFERKYNSYTPEFKLQVVEDMQTNGLSYRAAALKHSVGIHTTIKQWERIYLEKGYDGLKDSNRGLPGKPKVGRPPSKPTNKKKYTSKEAYDTLTSENKHLRMELEYLKKLNALIRSKEK